MARGCLVRIQSSTSRSLKAQPAAVRRQQRGNGGHSLPLSDGCRFHVDDMSSAHVYARLPSGMTHKTIPKGTAANQPIPQRAQQWSRAQCIQLTPIAHYTPAAVCVSAAAELLADCAQLTKANSIEGNKKTTGRVKVVYTPASNLLKTGAMTTGQVGFKANQLIAYATVEARDNAIVNRLDKTRVERPSESIQKEREERDAAERREEKEAKKARADEEKRVTAERKKEKEARSYDTLFDERNMTSNEEIRHASNTNDEDFDFM